MSPLTVTTSTWGGAGSAAAASAAAAEAAATTSVPRTQRAVSNLRMGMDVVGFCSQTRLLIVAGKGGVGKTTVTAALARMAARAGLTTLIVEVEGKSGLSAAFGRREALTYD